MNEDIKSVAIFDDDEDILSICHYVLQEQGWKVDTFANCDDIVSKLKICKPQVIFMDNWIPPKGGIVATQEIKSDSVLKDIPVIYFSANSEISKLASTAGAEHFLAKPFDLDHLSEAIAIVLKSRK